MYLDFKKTLAIFDFAIEITFAGISATSGLFKFLHNDDDDDDDGKDNGLLSLAFHAIHKLYSAPKISSEFDLRSVRAKLCRLAKGMSAATKRNPIYGGLHVLVWWWGSMYLQTMSSRSMFIFFNDLKNYQCQVIPKFSTYRKSNAERGRCARDVVSCEHEERQEVVAQVPILSMESKERSQLETLREDIQLPSILKSKVLTSINLWMNNCKSRSSTHYDPHHNLLCIVAGCKQVVLWPPSAGSLLYPMPVYGEASNHSSVDLGSPDFSIHPRAKRSMDYSQEVILHAGDALFIPEGWYHQVDSNDLTIAVNYWWQSSMVCNIQEYMDPYFLRILLRRLVNKEMDHMICGISFGDGENVKCLTKAIADEQKGREELEDPRVNYIQGSYQNHGTTVQHMEPETLRALHELISLVHDNVKIAGQSQSGESTSKDTITVETEDESKKMLKDKSSLLLEDPIARIIWTLEPLKLRAVLLAMVHNFPRTLEALIIHTLSPLGAEVLTRKFDEMDRLIPKEERDTFYMEFYAVFDDQGAAMDAILSGKESFAQQAFKNVLDKHLGVKH
ncbi:hypothetical protein Sjap_006486 [Stephania japonica]|uniref:JmjC domain-containing protein n=1 Tax=Stephania japonica TaxID=461633 RepID=A0AAP0K7J3_9MAGN